MNGPTQIRVVGKTYTIEYVERVDDKDSSGESARDTQSIKVKKDQHQESARETLLHEVIHAVEGQLGLDLKEKQVHGLGVGLFQVLCENPEFVRFITTGRKRG